MPLPVLVVGRSTDGLPVIRDANENACELYRSTISELIGLPLGDLSQDETWRAYAFGDLVAAFAKPREMVHTRRDGTPVSAEISASRVCVEGEELVVLVCRAVLADHERSDPIPDLRASERHFRLLAGAMPQLVWTARPDGTVDYYSSRIEEYAGHEFDTASGSWEALLHPEDRELTVEAWNRAVEAGSPYSVEHRLRASNGNYRWHLSRGVPARDASGDVIRWYGTATDVHDLKEAQAELQEARDRLAIALEAAEMGMWTSNFPASITHRTLRHDQIFGYSELQPHWNLATARRHVLEEDLEEFDAAVAESRRSGVLRHEVRVRWPDGSVHWIYSLGRFYYDEEGEPLGMAGVIMDITERKKVEEALRQLNEHLEDEVEIRTAELVAARDHFETAFHASPVATTIERLRDSTLLDVNEEFTRIFGYDPQAGDRVQKRSADLRMWVHRKDHRRLTEDALAGVSVRDREIAVRLASGETRTMLVSAERMEVNGEPAAMMMFLDITERKEAEDAVRRLTRALTLAEQRERRRLSQVLHDDLQQILFGVDMRTALLRAAIAGKGAAESSLVESQMEDLRGLIGEAIRCTRVLSVELNPPVLRGEGLEPALSWLARHMEEMHGLKVSLSLADGLSLPSEDQRVLVVQLARELLFNIVKHAGVLEARLGGEQVGDMLTIFVEDDGVGFDVVQALDRSSHRDSLGLFSVTERVRLFGGTLHVNSVPGQGTKIRLELPLFEQRPDGI